MASSKVDIILKAVDEYSNTLTGLNQGFELTKNVLGTLQTVAGAAFGAVKTGAELAFRGVAEAVDLAVKGGNYQELYNQLTNVAKHFRVDADAVIAVLDDLTDNVISMSDSVRLASKGIAAGFGLEELEVVFTFAKRRTEATGESFEVMSEQIINALQKGKYATLKDMGLIIEKGMDTADILREIERATKQYGETGYNTGDKIASLSNQIDKFWTRVGQAINASDSWAAAITGVQEAVIYFVKNLDYSAVTRFVDGALGAFSRMLGGVKFSSITDAFNVVINRLADLANSKKVQGIADRLFTVLTGAFKHVADADYTGMFNDIASAVERIAGPMGTLAAAVKLIVDETGFLSYAWSIVSETVRGGFNMILNIINANIGAVQQLGYELGKFVETGFSDMYDKTVNVGELIAQSFSEIPARFFNAIEERVNALTFEARKLLGMLDGSDVMTFDVGDTLSEEWARQREEGLAREQAMPEPEEGSAVAEMLSTANWPAEFQALGSFLFQWVLSAASGSTVPMAITTAR